MESKVRYIKEYIKHESGALLSLLKVVYSVKVSKTNTVTITMINSMQNHCSYPY